MELSAIESVLQKVDGVKAVAVVVLRPGQPDATLAAYCELVVLNVCFLVFTLLILGTPLGLSESALRAACARELPPYMIPEFFVFLAALPKTANGKLDKKALPNPEESKDVADESPMIVSAVEKRMLDAVKKLVPSPFLSPVFFVF